MEAKITCPLCGGAVNISIVRLKDAIPSPPISESANVCHSVSTANAVDEFICSNCGFATEEISRLEIADDGTRTNFEYEMKYCPNCGAKVLR